MMTTLYKNVLACLPKFIACTLLTGSVYANGMVPESTFNFFHERSIIVVAEHKANADASEDLAETAREAYEEEDAKPVEDWFGCPPTIKGDKEQNSSVTADGDDTIDPNCDPDAPQNDSPQKE